MKKEIKSEEKNELKDIKNEVRTNEKERLVKEEKIYEKKESLKGFFVHSPTKYE